MPGPKFFKLLPVDVSGVGLHLINFLHRAREYDGSENIESIASEKIEDNSRFYEILS